jgi:outer membrane biosynthesis protein TonB
MWPWQRNGEQPSHTLVRRLLFLSTAGHIGLLMFLFVFYKDNTTNVSRDVIAVLLDMDVTIVKVPLKKVMHKTAPIIGSGNKTVAAAPAPKEAPPVTALSKAKEPNVAIAKAKKPEKSKKETKPKKEKPKEKEKPKTPQLAKVEPKKLEEKKPEPPPPVIAQAVAAENVEPVTDSIASEQMVVGDNVVYVGQQEYEALEVQRQIQQEAQKWWKAPPGVGADVACQVVVHVEHDGTIGEVLIAKESGVLMFDVCARQAVSQMEFPRGSWGKEVVVYFKQS